MEINWYNHYSEPAYPYIYYQSRRRTGVAYKINVGSLFLGNRALWESTLIAEHNRYVAENGRYAAEEQARRDRQAAEEQARRDRQAVEEQARRDRQAAEAALILEQQREQAIKERDELAAEADAHRAKLLEAEAELTELTQRLADQSRRRWLCWPRRRRQPSTAQESVPPPYEGKA